MPDVRVAFLPVGAAPGGLAAHGSEARGLDTRLVGAHYPLSPVRSTGGVGHDGGVVWGQFSPSSGCFECVKIGIRLTEYTKMKYRDKKQIAIHVVGNYLVGR